MELRLPEAAQLKAIYERDLRTSFPPAELKPLWNMESMWAEGWYHPWCLFEGEEIIGEAFLWLGDPGWALLDYLCVTPGHRNRGLGALLLETMRQAEPPGTVILAESEAPVHAPDPNLAGRRLGFYARNHARTAGYDTDMFGVHYKTLYWSETDIPDEELIRRHQFIYRNRFSPEKYAKYVRIPRDPEAPPLPRSPWNEA